MAGTTAAILGSAALGTAGSIYGAKRQSDAIEDGADAAGIAELERIRTANQFTAPQREVGNQALNALGSLFVPGYSGLDVSGQAAPWAGSVAGDPRAGGGAGGGGGWTGRTGGVVLSGDYNTQQNDAVSQFISNNQIKRMQRIFGGTPTHEEMLAYIYGDQFRGMSPDQVSEKGIRKFYRAAGENADPRAIRRAIRKIGRKTNEQKASAGLLRGRNQKDFDALANYALGNRERLSKLQTMADPKYGRLDPITAQDVEDQFMNLPGVEFLRNEATRATDNQANLYGAGGNTLDALANRHQNIAYQSVVPMRSQLAGYGVSGQNAASNVAASNQMPSIEGNRGVADANIQGQLWQNLGNTGQNAISNWLTYQNLNQGNQPPNTAYNPDLFQGSGPGAFSPAPNRGNNLPAWLGDQ